MLRVAPQTLTTRAGVAETSGRPFERPLFVSAVRCTLRYVLFPFLLPLIGVTTSAVAGIVVGAALGVLLVLNALAATSVVATLRWLWGTHHPRRWQYLPVAAALAVLIGIFAATDLRALYNLYV